MHVPDVTMFSKITSNNDKGKDQRNAKQNKSTRAASGIMNTFHSLWICVAILLHMASKTTVEAFCTPVNETSLQNAVIACLKETPDGSCPNLAASSDSPGCGNNGGVNGVIGDWDVSRVKSIIRLFVFRDTFNADISKWDVSSVTNMVASTSLSLSLPLFLTHLYRILIMNRIN